MILLAFPIPKKTNNFHLVNCLFSKTNAFALLGSEALTGDFDSQFAFGDFRFVLNDSLRV